MGDSTKIRSFENDPPSGWTIGRPHLDIAGGYYGLSNNGVTANAAFFEAHVQMGVASPYLQLSSDIQFVPKFNQANPTASLVLQVAPLGNGNMFYVSGGGGLITGHTGTGAAAGWVQAQVAYRTPIHVVTLFAQVGHALNSGAATEYLIGVVHPLAPYRLHGIRS